MQNCLKENILSFRQDQDICLRQFVHELNIAKTNIVSLVCYKI